MRQETRYLTSVAIDGGVVLIEGASGAGKSDLALRLIDRGATLVSDDQTVLSVEGGRLLASAPATIAGKLEVRGVGIASMPHAAHLPVMLLVVLHPDPPRLPHPMTRHLLEVPLPVMLLDPLPASAPIKVELALRQLAGGAA